MTKYRIIKFGANGLYYVQRQATYGPVDWEVVRRTSNYMTLWGARRSLKRVIKRETEMVPENVVVYEVEA